MPIMKEKRAFERIGLDNIRGSVELMEIVKPISIVNACEEGVCVNGADFPVGSVVRLAIASQEEHPDISLYCKVVWASHKEDPERKSGLFFLNTNKILFRKDLLSFARLIESTRKQSAL
jgi:hypothetical protein